MNTVYITILSALLSNSVAPSSATECSEKWTIDYISNESQKAYSESVDCFFGTFAKSIAKINKNKRNEDLRKILTLGLKVVGNAEVTEAWSEFVENLVINDSIFFLDAVILTDKKNQIFISNALKSPLFMEAKDIRSKITPYSKLNKYKSFFGLYGSRK